VRPGKKERLKTRKETKHGRGREFKPTLNIYRKLRVS